MFSEKTAIYVTVGIIAALVIVGVVIVAHNTADDHPHEVSITATIDGVFPDPSEGRTRISIGCEVSSYCYIYFETRDGSMHYLTSQDKGYDHFTMSVEGIYTDADIIRIRAYDRML